jgi:hypothetical protein
LINVTAVVVKKVVKSNTSFLRQANHFKAQLVVLVMMLVLSSTNVLESGKFILPDVFCYDIVKYTAHISYSSAFCSIQGLYCIDREGNVVFEKKLSPTVVKEANN